MKQYFAKYLPAEGKVQAGDHVQAIEDGNVLYVELPQDVVYATPNLFRKVKLFLCSRDIQNGDEITYIGEDKDFIKKGDKGGCRESTELNWSIECWTKLIGEISSGAIWVKEGDEFDKDELMQNGTGVNITAGGSRLRIKCPTCKFFH